MNESGLAVHAGDDGVLRIELARPDKLNAATAVLLDDLADVVQAAGTDSTVRAITLSGAGRGFCAGIDLENAESDRSLAAANAAVRALHDVPVPVVAMVHGPAAGVGCSLALACDVVVMARSAYFVLAFSKIGLMPDGGATALISASIGRARAMKMALLGEKVDAAAASAWGLVSEVVDDDALQQEGSSLAARLARGPSAANGLTKQAINAASLDGLEAAISRETVGQSLLSATTDFAEGVSAFLAKREPQFGAR